ncbi:MAG: hypothetical protein IPO04_15715 [Cytophagaceae bacterium]|nr:hypothetical protein [Cytophagaceae bacterium]
MISLMSRNGLWNSDSLVAKYYKNVQFDSCRFDYVKGLTLSHQPWMTEVGGLE